MPPTTTRCSINENSATLPIWHCFLVGHQCRTLTSDASDPSTSGAGRGSTHGLSSALQVMNRLHRQDLNATFYQNVLNRRRYMYTLHCTCFLFLQLHGRRVWHGEPVSPKMKALLFGQTRRSTWDWLRWRGSNPSQDWHGCSCSAGTTQK